MLSHKELRKLQQTVFHEPQQLILRQLRQKHIRCFKERDLQQAVFHETQQFILRQLPQLFFRQFAKLRFLQRFIRPQRLKLVVQQEFLKLIVPEQRLVIPQQRKPLFGSEQEQLRRRFKEKIAFRNGKTGQRRIRREIPR